VMHDRDIYAIERRLRHSDRLVGATSEETVALIAEIMRLRGQEDRLLRQGAGGIVAALLIGLVLGAALTMLVVTAI
jgi:hypothetical protein